eukprot:s4263_g6.t4
MLSGNFRLVVQREHEHFSHHMLLLSAGYAIFPSRTSHITLAFHFPAGQPMSSERGCDAGTGVSPEVASDVFIPYIKHTFLASPPERPPELGGRSRSEEWGSCCDRFAVQVHSLMFKVQPLEHREGSVPASSSATPSETEAASDAEIMPEPPRELSDEALRLVPLDEDGKLTSIGSTLHAEGECRPCAFLSSIRRPCRNGAACLFCHFSHEARYKLRLGRRKRKEMRTGANAALEAAGAEGIAPAPRYIPISWPVSWTLGKPLQTVAAQRNCRTLADADIPGFW